MVRWKKITSYHKRIITIIQYLLFINTPANSQNVIISMNIIIADEGGCVLLSLKPSKMTLMSQFYNIYSNFYWKNPHIYTFALAEKENLYWKQKSAWCMLYSIVFLINVVRTWLICEGVFIVYTRHTMCVISTYYYYCYYYYLLIQIDWSVTITKGK